MQDLDEMFEDEEQWIIIQGFSRYAVSTHGRVKSIGHDRMLQANVNQRDMPMLFLVDDDGRRHTKLLPRLVAEHFIPRPEDRFDTPINLNGDRRNCHVANLLWRTRPFAIRFHRQYNWDIFHGDETRLLLLDTGEEFDTVRQPVRRFGLMCTDIWANARTRSPVWPTRQRYALL